VIMQTRRIGEMPIRRVFFFLRAALLAKHAALALRSHAGAAPLDGSAFLPR
jgi:hypothetical protein